MCNKDPWYVFIEKRKARVGWGLCWNGGWWGGGMDATSWGNSSFKDVFNDIDFYCSPNGAKTRTGLLNRFGPAPYKAAEERKDSSALGLNPSD